VDGAPVPAFCSELNDEIRVAGDPLVTLLEAVRTEHSQIQRGSPTADLQELEYTVGFEVERERTSTGEVKLLVFSFGGERSRTRTTTQELTLTFKLNFDPTF
jgi:hypothetical protein